MVQNQTNDTVKLIIEIPKELHEALLNGYEEPYSRMFSDVVKEATPLNDVTAKIEEHRRKTETLDKYDLLGDALDIINKCTESEDE